LVSKLFLFPLLLILQSSPEDAYREQFLKDPVVNRNLFLWLRQTYRNTHRFEDLIELSDAGLEASPGDTLFLLTKIRSQLDARRMNEAFREGDRYLVLEPTRAGYARLGRIYRSKGLPREALELWRRGRTALGKDHLFAREFYLKALNERDYLEAIREALNGLLDGETLSWVTREMTRVARFLGEDRTENEIQGWVRAHPEVREGHVVLGQFYLDRGNLELASRELRAAQDEAGLMALAGRLSVEGMYELCLDVLESIPEGERSGAYHGILGRTLRGLGRFEDAASALKRAYESGEEAVDELVSCYLEDLRDPEAVLALEPRHGVDLRGHWARALFHLGEPDSALTLLEGAGENIRGEDRFLQGELLFYSGRAEASDSVLKAFINDAPDAPQVTQALFYLEIITSLKEEPGFGTYVALERDLALGRHSEVLDAAREAALAETDSTLRSLDRFVMGRALLRTDRVGEAIGLFREIGAESPDYVGARSLFEAYRAAEALGDMELGEEILRDLILGFPDSPYAQVARSYL
jgi:tetratricopeptide (TPR) repeat protein